MFWPLDAPPSSHPREPLPSVEEPQRLLDTEREGGKKAIGKWEMGDQNVDKGGQTYFFNPLFDLLGGRRDIPLKYPSLPSFEHLSTPFVARDCSRAVPHTMPLTSPPPPGPIKSNRFQLPALFASFVMRCRSAEMSPSRRASFVLNVCPGA